jgi:hypothetical protein
MTRRLKTFGGWDKTRAVTMWENGHDTLQIAERLRVPESYIYNNLPKWRGDNELILERA